VNASHNGVFLQTESQSARSGRRAGTAERTAVLLEVSDGLAEGEEEGLPGAPISHASKLFHRGSTRMPCFPIISTRLEVLAWHNKDLVFWEGFGLIFISVISILAPLVRFSKA